MDADTKQEFRSVRAQMQALDTRLSAEMRKLETMLRQEVRDDGSGTCRHVDAVAESLRDAIRSVVEGLTSLEAKLDTIREPQ